MYWVGKAHPLETLAECGAPILLAWSAGWAASAVGLPLAAKAASVVLAFVAGMMAMRFAGHATTMTEAGFELVDFEPAEEEDVLLLDDPLVEVAADSRVVRLFARSDPTPGELVLRISDYLSEQGKAPLPASPPDEQKVDASAALHSALANIRATLR